MSTELLSQTLRHKHMLRDIPKPPGLCLTVRSKRGPVQHLSAIHERVQWMADEEARTAWVGGRAADGVFLAKKERLCDATDRILDELEQGLNDA